MNLRVAAFGLYYIVGIAYALVSGAFGRFLTIMTVAMMGIPLVLHAGFAALSAAVACHAGAVARRSIWHAVLAIPCVFVYVMQIPVVMAKDALGMPVPWLWERSSSFDQVFPQCMFLLGIACVFFAGGFLFASLRAVRGQRDDGPARERSARIEAEALDQPTLAEIMRSKDGK